jgi:hypothetical protein
VCDHDGKIESLIKELLSCHRRQGGVCTWSTHKKIYLNNDQKKETKNIERIELKQCVFNKCENELLTSFYRSNNGDITITVTDD